jgi:hypothetical protein
MDLDSFDVALTTYETLTTSLSNVICQRIVWRAVVRV